MALTDNLVGYYSFENNTNDELGNHSATSSTLNYATGKNGQAADFNVSSGGMTIPTITLTGDFSISWWMKLGNNGNGVVFANSDGSDGFNIYPFGGTAQAQYWGGNTGITTDGSWKHYVLTRTGSTITLYCNNSVLNYWTRGGTLEFSKIGGPSGPNWSSHLTGLMDEFAVWSRGLTDSEITNLYNSGDGLGYSSIGAPPAPSFRPMNIFTQLTAALGAVFMEGLDAFSQKITGLADGVGTDDAVNLGQLTGLSSSAVAYVDAADTAIQNNLNAASGALKTYIDAADAAQDAATSGLSSSLKNYIDAADTAQDLATAALSSSVVAYVDSENAAQDAAVSAFSSSMAAKVEAVDSAQTAANAALSSSLKGYVDAADAAQDAATGALSSSIKSYVDSADAAQDAATSALSSSLVSKIEAADAQLQSNINSVSSSMKSYVDAADTQIQNNLDSASGSLKAYIDAQDSAQDAATSALSSSIVSYVDAADAAQDAATATLSSSIKTYVDAADSALQSELNAVSGAMKSYVDAADSAQDTAMATLSSSIKGYVDAANTTQDTATTALSSSVHRAIVDESKDRQAEDSLFLKLDGSRSMSGSLNMGGQDIVNAKSGSFSGDVTVAGNLQVNGATASINSTNLEVSDKLVTIAKGAINGAAADGAGLEVDGAGASFVYDNASGKWVSNIGLEVSNQASFDAAAKLSGSAFTFITASVVGGKFDVSDALHALDTKIGDDLTALHNKYDGLRAVITGTLGAGGGGGMLNNNVLSYLGFDGNSNDSAGAVTTTPSAIGYYNTFDAWHPYPVPKKGQGVYFPYSYPRIQTSNIALGSEWSFTWWWACAENDIGSKGDPSYVFNIASQDSNNFIGLKKNADQTMWSNGMIDVPHQSMSPVIRLNGTDHFFSYKLFDKLQANMPVNLRPNSAVMNWHMFTISVSGGVATLYVNGVLDSTINISPSLTINNLFCLSDNSLVPFGAFDEMSFWNKALTQTEVESIYNGGSGTTYSDLSSIAASIPAGTEAGAAVVDLSSFFPSTEISNIALDVMVNEGDGFTNNLVSAKMFVDSGALKVQIDAPAAAVGSVYRVIAVDEKKGGLS